jgi:hypothetical protein
MPIDLPNLDDRRYSDLMEEALRMIPAHAPEWTNHNPSDPGITLIELFAHLTEMLIYRLNRVTPEATLSFLKLINGPEWMPCPPERDAEAWSKLVLRDRDTEFRKWWYGSSMEERGRMVADTVRQLREPRRAVASADFQALARAVDQRVARVHCIPGNGDGHIRVIVVPRPFSTPLTPKQAAGRKGEVVTVQFTVKGAGWGGSRSEFKELYSEGSWNHPDNFFVRIPRPFHEQLSALGIKDVGSHFNRQLIHATGRVALLSWPNIGEFPVIVVEKLEHINIAFEVPPTLKTKIETTLRNSCLLTTQIDVESPKLAKVDIMLTLVVEADAVKQDARAEVELAINKFLDPLKWPFGQAIYVSKLTELFADLPGIRDVRDITLSVMPAMPAVKDTDTEKIIAMRIDRDALAVATEIKIT